MKIILNSKDKMIKTSNLKRMLLSLRYDPERVIVSVNGALVEKNKFFKIALSDGDIVEVFSFVGGG